DGMSSPSRIRSARYAAYGSVVGDEPVVAVTLAMVGSNRATSPAEGHDESYSSRNTRSMDALAPSMRSLLIMIPAPYASRKWRSTLYGLSCLYPAIPHTESACATMSTMSCDDWILRLFMRSAKPM